MVAVPFETIAAGTAGRPGHAELTAAVDAARPGAARRTPIPRTIASCASRAATASCTATRSGRPLGYGYAWETGRIGPVAVRDEALTGPVVGHLLRSVEPRGAQAIWVPGAAGPMIELLLEPACASRTSRSCSAGIGRSPISSRYLPISPGLL